MKQYGNDRMRFLVGAPPVGLTHHQRVHPDDIGKFAMSLIQAWGVAGIDPSAGKNGRLLSADEIVLRAMRAAELTFQEMGERGWLVTLPDYEEIAAESGSAGFIKGGEQ